ncbi:condensation domain-containing protein, partial [Spartinivicinus poritis]
MDKGSKSVSVDAQLQRKLEGLSPEKRALVEKLLAQKKQQRKAHTQILPTTKSENEIPVSFSQQRLWLLDQLEGSSSHYNIPVALKLIGDVNEKALEKALKTIIDRHQSLRTVFYGTTEQAFQKIKKSCDNFSLEVNHLPNEKINNKNVKALVEEAAAASFDLSADTLLRAHLWTLAENTSVLLLVVHHIAADGWSIGVLVNELNLLYQAFIKNQLSPLPELPIQYSDYAIWQRKYLSGVNLDGQLNYWKRQLLDIPNLHSLPLDKPRPSEQSYAGAVYQTKIDKYTTDQFKRLCRQQDATLFMGIYTVLTVLIARYSGETDVVIGTTTANRDQQEVAELIGFFVNMLVLRINIDEQASFIQLLEGCKSVALGAFRHQQTPFEKVVEALNPSRDLSYQPLFQIMLAVQNNQEAQLDLSGLTFSEMPITAHTAKFDLSLNVDEEEGQLVIDWEYCTDLFEASTIERMAASFNQLLISLLANPEQNVFSLPMLSAAEQQRLLMDYNKTAAEYPKAVSLPGLFEA